MSEEGLSKVKVREINETIRYTAWTAFHIDARGVSKADQKKYLKEIKDFVASWKKRDILVRGIYDVSGLRADADFMFWIHANKAEEVQEALHEFSRTALGRRSTAVWSAMGLHRPAEFNKGHVPAFMMGAPARQWAVVYPFVRSYEWYLLPDEERRAMLVEHGMAGRDFSGILSNTVSAFALGDYEWILALESEDLHEMVDMMRELRNTQARKHVRVEIPFYTGHLISHEELAGLFA
jgi:hydrogen peroxide-dependent heme synthase